MLPFFFPLIFDQLDQEKARKKMTDLQEAKKIIMDHLDDILIVKSTRWEFHIHSESKVGEYVEVDAGYTEEEMRLMQSLRYRDMSEYLKLKELLEELI